MDSDLDYYQRNMWPSEMEDGEDDDDYGDYSVEEGWAGQPQDCDVPEEVEA